MGILRLSHVDITVPDIDLATAYYTEVMGLSEVERTSDRVFFKCWDEEDHHSLAVRYDPRVGIDRFSYKVEDADDLAELEDAVETASRLRQARKWNSFTRSRRSAACSPRSTLVPCPRA